jgi:hypothetical protein
MAEDCGFVWQESDASPGFPPYVGIDVNRQSGGSRTITMTNEQAVSAVNAHVGMSVGKLFE